MCRSPQFTPSHAIFPRHDRLSLATSVTEHDPPSFRASFVLHARSSSTQDIRGIASPRPVMDGVSVPSLPMQPQHTLCTPLPLSEEYPRQGQRFSPVPSLGINPEECITNACWWPVAFLGLCLFRQSCLIKAGHLITHQGTIVTSQHVHSRL